MEIILRTSVPGLGERGDVVKVKDGYARNYLLPRKMALPATKAMKKVMSEENKLRGLRDDKEKRGLLDMAEKMKDLSVTIVVQAGDENKLYGSVGEYDIARAITEQGFEVDHNMVKLEEHIKVLGVYTVPIRLHREVEVLVKVWVVKE
jgi:large subunit ribosomal protein L9